MSTDALMPAEEFTHRYHRAAEALDSASVVLTMSRLVRAARSRGEGTGEIIERATGCEQAGRVGLLASSMNPLTRAHVALAEAARRSGGLDALYWVATLVTIDKEAVERATLVDRLIEAQAYAQVTGDGLLLLGGGLYVEQVRAAHTLLGQETQIALIVGYDKIVQIFDPRYYDNREAALDDLFSEAEIIVAPRDGAGEVDLRALLDAPENRVYAHRVSYCPLPERYAKDSSTEGRAMATSGEEGEPLRDLLTPEGLALTLTARPFDPPRQPEPFNLGDRYSARQRLLAAFGKLREPDLASAPRIAQLVTWSAERTPRGAALRAWARGETSDAAEGLRSALSAR